MVNAQSSLDFATGKALFEKNWVFAPASTGASDGLGPYYNARSCGQCHPEGGRGSLADALVVHSDDPVYGGQLQKFTRPGVPAEATYTVVWRDAAAGLKAPQVQIDSLHYGVMENPAVSLRLAPALAGLVMLEAIPDAAIMAMADAEDANGDGISGRVNRLQDNSIGRFGWKASQSRLRDQVGRALGLDLGLGNPLLPSPYGDCTLAQTDCRAAPHGNSARQDNLEVNSLVLELLLTYVRGLGVPEEVHLETAEVMRGAELFNNTGCGACHIAEFVVEGNRFAPYTDLLLHDMGPGLADDLGEGSAAGSEWRTAPLWGLGRVNRMNSGYLHDGRAATLHEAILWHDGEGSQAWAAYLKLNETERSNLITFLNAL